MNFDKVSIIIIFFFFSNLIHIKHAVHMLIRNNGKMKFRTE